MNIEQEKMIVEALPSLYPLQEFEEKAIDTVLNAIPHWIPVTERLPEEEDSIFARYYGTDRWRKAMFRKKSREVIVTSVFEDGELHTEVAHTTDGEWHVGVNVVPRTVIAWMPLPESYKGGDWMKPSTYYQGNGHSKYGIYNKQKKRISIRNL